MLLERIQTIPLRYSEVIFENKKYAVTRTDFNQGKSIKLYAEQLGGIDFVSFNYYVTKSKELLKPCDMTSIKVITFLNNYKLI